jgi:hypothetical protein
MSRKLQTSTSDPSVWVKQNSKLRTQHASLSPGSDNLLPDDLRRQVIREAVVDRRWRDLSSPTLIATITPQYPTESRSIPKAFWVQILAGGDHVLFLLYDGTIDICSVTTGLSSMQAEILPSGWPKYCEESVVSLRPIHSSLFMVSENEGYLICELECCHSNRILGHK